MKKILFNSKYGLEQAVLDGRKTMTRRTISPKIWEKYSEYEMGFAVKGLENIFGALEDSHEYLIGLSPYKVGEVVAIAQRYCDIFHNGEVASEEQGWGNKMFVKAELMPHHIKITDIKVERLQDISDEDCLREGIKPCNLGKKFTPGDKRAYNTAREAFAALIDKVGKRGDWNDNPWIFAYSFELVD